MEVVAAGITRIAYKRGLFPEKCFDVFESDLSFRVGSHPGVDCLIEKLNVLQKNCLGIYSLTLGIVRNHEIKETWTFYLFNKDPVQGSWEREMEYLDPIDASSVVLQVQYQLDCPESYSIPGFKECEPTVVNTLEERLGTTGESVLVGFWQENDNSDVRSEFTNSTTNESGFGIIPESQQGTNPDNGDFNCICHKPVETDRTKLIRCATCSNICHYCCVGYTNPKQVDGPFRCPYCKPTIAQHVSNADYVSYLSQLALLRRLIREMHMRPDNCALTVEELLSLITVELPQIQELIFYLQDMNFGRFQINKQPISCFRLLDITGNMSVQIQKDRQSTEVIRKIFTQVVMEFKYFNSYKTKNALWKSFNRVEPMTMSRRTEQ